MIVLNKNNSPISVISELILTLSVILQLILIVLNLFYIENSINYAMYINNYIIGFMIIICLAARGTGDHFLALAFFCCYMLFLMGQKPFEPEYNVYLTFTRVVLDTKNYFLFSSILFMGLSTTYYSYLLFSSKKRNNKDRGIEKQINYQNLKPILAFLLALTIPCALYMQGKIVLVRSSMSYTSGYLVNVDVPAVFKIGYYIFSTVILLYLALKPTKRQLLIVLAFYLLIEGGMQLFQGRRALFASTLFFLIWYLLKYYNIRRIRGKTFLRVLIILIALTVVFFVVEQARDSNSTNLSFKLVRKLLVSTGGSDSVIANTIFRKDQFPKSGITYLLDPFINNPIGNILTGKKSVPQGLEYLQLHNSFSHWLSYLTEPSLYLSGHGMGSCYLAESYLAFGLPGVLLISIMLGWVINKLDSFQFNKNPFVIGFVFFLARRIFTLPRDSLFSWVSSSVYLIFTYMLLLPFFLYYCQREKLVDEAKE